MPEGLSGMLTLLWRDLQLAQRTLWLCLLFVSALIVEVWRHTISGAVRLWMACMNGRDAYIVRVARVQLGEEPRPSLLDSS